jgi:O-antigen/teichoic acid export membrane protein
MEFGKHISKGLWGFADKSLAVLYGLGFIFLVIRVIPEHEYGSFVIIQAIFALITALSTSFALQPLIKFAAETENYGSVTTTSFLLHFGFLLFASVIVVIVRIPLAILLDVSNAAYLSDLFLFIPLLILSSFLKSFLISLLQTRFRVAEIFWIDSVFFLGSLILFYVAKYFSLLHTAKEVIYITVTTHLLSTLIAILLTKKIIKFEKKIDKDTFAKVFQFGKYSLASSLCFSLYAQMDIFLLSYFGGVVQVAIYSAAKIFTRIFDVFNQVIQLFVVPASSKLNARNDTGSLQVLIEKSIWFSTLALLPLLILLLFGADFLISFFYKGRYADASLPLRIFGLLALITPWFSVLPSILVGIGKVKQGLYISWVFIVVSVILFSIFIPIWGAVGAAISIIIASVILSISSAFVVNKSIKIRFRKLISRTTDIKEFLKQYFLKSDAK